MNLHFNQNLAKNYKSPSQIIRVLSEDWVAKQSYCPNCDAQPLAEFTNNKPVADFYCANCNEQYELKSKQAKLSNIINDKIRQQLQVLRDRGIIEFTGRGRYCKLY